MENSKSNFDRRKFLKSSALVGAFLGLPGAAAFAQSDADIAIENLTAKRPSYGKSVIGLKTSPIEQVKVAFIGVGNRGSGHVKQMAALHPKATITAICDIREEYAQKSVDLAKGMGQDPKMYSDKVEAWKEMLKRDDIDLVIIATTLERPCSDVRVCHATGQTCCR